MLLEFKHLIAVISALFNMATAPKGGNMKKGVIKIVLILLSASALASDGTGTVGGVQKKPDLPSPKDPKPIKPKAN